MAGDAPQLFSNAGDRVVVEQGQLLQLEKIRQRKTTAGVEVIKVNLASLSAPSTEVRLSDAEGVTLSKTDVKRSASGFTWSGESNSKPGRATLVVRDQNITGSLWVGTHLYKVESIGGGLHALISVNQAGYPAESPTASR